MWFGIGFSGLAGLAGLAGLWTFVIIEIRDVIRIILDPTTIPDSLDDVLVSAAVDLLVNQFSNRVTALVWFGYWQTKA